MAEKKPSNIYNLTKKQKVFADELIECGSPTEAARRAYDCKNDQVAHTLGVRNSNHAHIQSYIEAQFELNGTVSKSLKVVDDALDANLSFQGVATSSPDHQTRLKASKQAMELVQPKEKLPKSLHLERHEHKHYSFGMDIPKSVLQWIAGEGKGRWPTEEEFKRLVNGKPVQA